VYGNGTELAATIVINSQRPCYPALPGSAKRAVFGSWEMESDDLEELHPTAANPKPV
jgi:hypothetical protein